MDAAETTRLLVPGVAEYSPPNLQELERQLQELPDLGDGGSLAEHKEPLDTNTSWLGPRCIPSKFVCGAETLTCFGSLACLFAGIFTGQPVPTAIGGTGLAHQAKNRVMRECDPTVKLGLVISRGNQQVERLTEENGTLRGHLKDARSLASLMHRSLAASEKNRGEINKQLETRTEELATVRDDLRAAAEVIKSIPALQRDFMAQTVKFAQGVQGLKVENAELKSGSRELESEIGQLSKDLEDFKMGEVALSQQVAKARELGTKAKLFFDYVSGQAGKLLELFTTTQAQLATAQKALEGSRGDVGAAARSADTLSVDARALQAAVQQLEEQLAKEKAELAKLAPIVELVKGLGGPEATVALLQQLASQGV